MCGSIFSFSIRTWHIYCISLCLISCFSHPRRNILKFNSSQLSFHSSSGKWVKSELYTDYSYLWFPVHCFKPKSRSMQQSSLWLDVISKEVSLVKLYNVTMQLKVKRSNDGRSNGIKKSTFFRQKSWLMSTGKKRDVAVQ